MGSIKLILGCLKGSFVERRPNVQVQKGCDHVMTLPEKMILGIEANETSLHWSPTAALQISTNSLSNGTNNKRDCSIGAGCQPRTVLSILSSACTKALHYGTSLPYTSLVLAIMLEVFDKDSTSHYVPGRYRQSLHCRD